MCWRGYFQALYFCILDKMSTHFNHLQEALQTPGLLWHVLCHIDGQLCCGAAIFWVFGEEVAELPLVATKTDCQGKGYFQALVKLLINLNVKVLDLQKIDDGREIGNWVTSVSKRMDISNKCLKNSSFFLDSIFGCNLVSLNLRLNFADDARDSLCSREKLSFMFPIFNIATVLAFSLIIIWGKR